VQKKALLPESEKEIPTIAASSDHGGLVLFAASIAVRPTGDWGVSRPWVCCTNLMLQCWNLVLVLGKVF
jgi:hypothetical protein